MPTLVHEYDWPDRVVVGTVGRPGERTFYLQVRHGARSTSVALEKEQSVLLAAKMDGLLDELTADPDHPVTAPQEVPDELIDNDPLDQPVEEEFRSGTMTLGWDPRTAQIVIEAFALDERDEGEAVEPGEDGLDEPSPDEPSAVLRVRIPVGAARAFAQRTRQVAFAGRPICPLCARPIDPDGHVCDLTDDR
ncbi:DUF3090 domain-containing protein [Ruania halotolerans]|uniref:DUF3090 domain-containing protein n=1 Tax=Ruania halotolerans TaxID=2897773 RepID=UPI001E38622F|nr:DUF3090 domain-containing protein [Ruania halotolerans]UFU07336.1 DUF3090 domain-containing protein [Ruania halotolerans]